MPMHNYKALSKLKTITVLILTTFGSNALEFNHKAFQDEVSKIYTLDSSLQTLDTKSVLNELFDVKDIRIKEALNTICENEVGSTMIKLFYQSRSKMTKKLKLKAKHFKYAEKTFRNVFVDDEFTIFMSPKRIANIKTIGFCDGKISEKTESLDSVLFHELGHAFHYLMNRSCVNSIDSLNNIYGHSEEKYLWTDKDIPNDEEFFNITGYFYSKGIWRFDPLNTNMYDICKQCKTEISRDNVKQRLFHSVSIMDPMPNISLLKRFVLNLGIWLLDKE